MSNFCFTGFFKLNGRHVKRATIKTMVVEAGHRFDTSVRWDTDYLVVGSLKAGVRTNKVKKSAVHSHTKNISPDQAFLLLNGTGSLEGESYVEEL